MQPVVFVAHSEADTDRLGRLLAETLPDGTVVNLIGTLGSGKTRLVQSLVAGSGLSADMVTSPTFTICHEYTAARLIHHLDWYRIRDAQELLDLGIEEYFATTGLVLIEWGDRFAEVLPDRRIDIEIQITGTDSRCFQITAQGGGWETFLQTLRNRT